MRTALATWIALAALTVLACLCATTSASASTSPNVRLVDQGEPAAVIVLPAGAGARSDAQAAAELLQMFIHRMSGAELAIVREDELARVTVVPAGEGVRVQADGLDVTCFILLGESELTRKLGVDTEGLGPGGIRLKTLGNAVALLGGPERVTGERGADDGGLRYATIELLEQLGCHYLWPGELGMVIPQRDTIDVEPMDMRYTPVIRSRHIRTERLRAADRSGLESLGISVERWIEGEQRALGDVPDIDWRAWHRLGGRLPRFGHAGSGLRDAERHLRENPEWFALQADGTRDQGGIARWRLCKSNLQLIEHVAQDIIQQANEDPDLELVSLDPNDGGYATWCLCENCKVLDPSDAPTVTLNVFEQAGNSRREAIEHPSLTDRLLFYWNGIADRVTEEHPHLTFGISAYSRFADPPVERRAHPNLVLRYVRSHPEFIDGWKEAGIRQMYWRPNNLNPGRRDGKLRSFIGDMAHTMHQMVEAGVTQTDMARERRFWAVHGLTYYAAARLNWNPHLTAEQIIAGYARVGFGDGAPWIEAYIQRIEELTEAEVQRALDTPDDRIYTPDVLRELRDLLARAEEAANDSVIAQRIAFLRIGLNFTELQETLSEKAARAEAGEDVDRELAQRLIDLRSLMLREIIDNHHFTINAAYLVRMSGTFAQDRAIGGRTVTPSDSALLERLDNPRFGMTGREQSLEEMLDAFGL